MRIRITDSPRGLRILQLMNELADTRGYDVYSKLMALNTSIYILDKNCNDLDLYVQELTSQPKWRHLFLVENRELLHGVSQDVVRRLHNYVAAASSLRDHTRAFFNKHYKDGNLMPEYEDRVRLIFGEDPLAQFINNLRQYCQHYRSPHINYRTVWDEGGSPSCTTAIILKEDLLTFDGWNQQAKAYLDAIEGGVDIVAIAKSYRSKVLSFYQWFQTEQERVHREELGEFKDKEAELLRLQLEDKVDRCLATRDPMDCSERSIFFHMFLKREYEQLSQLPPHSPERVNLAVTLVRQHFDIDPRVAKKLREAYSLPQFSHYGEIPSLPSYRDRLTAALQTARARVSRLFHRTPPGSA